MLVGSHALPGKSDMALVATRDALFLASLNSVEIPQDWACAMWYTAGRGTTEPRLRAPVERARFRRTKAILGGRLLRLGSVCRGFLVYTLGGLCLHGTSGRLGRGGVRLRKIDMHSRRKEVDLERRVMNAFAGSGELDVARAF